jgi:hypothetical protein
MREICKYGSARGADIVQLLTLRMSMITPDNRYFSLALLFPGRHGASEFRTCIAPTLDRWLESR